MKTPRDILLGRHKAAEPKLDDIREDVIAELNNKGAKSQSALENLLSLALDCPKAIWRELVLPSRRIWAGLAAVWILILAANFSMRDNAETKMAKSQPSPRAMTALRQQQQLLKELMSEDPRVAEAQKSYSPRPASERHLELLIT